MALEFCILTATRSYAREKRGMGRPSPNGVGQSTASAKARVVSDALHAHRMDPAWMLPSLVDQNPLVWMAKVNGALVDLRDMPRKLQVIAYEKGMIPYVPADKE
jgi:hypothetical protein